MAIGPVWEALIHATSCHLPPLPACSPSAAARLLSPLMSIFRAGWFLPSKTGNVLWNRKVRGIFFCFFCCCLSETYYCVRSANSCTCFAHPCWCLLMSQRTVHSYTHARIHICIRLLSVLGAPRETVDWRFWFKIKKRNDKQQTFFFFF